MVANPPIITLEDINALVALASTIPRRRNPTLSRRDPEVHEHRLNVILDAIASLCVSQPKGEVYSTSMEVISAGPGPGGEVRLFLAGNVDVSEDVRNYVEQLWKMLRDIAQSCHGARKSLNPKDPCLQWGYEGNSPDRKEILDHEDLQRFTVEFMHMVYSHCFPKFIARVQKRWEQYLEFLRVLDTEVLPPGADIPRDILPVFLLRDIGNILWGSDAINPKEVTAGNVDLYALIEAICDIKNLISKKEGVYERLSMQVVRYGGPNFPLTRYLDKIVSLHLSADVLVRYACSPRLRTHFTNKRLLLTTVPNTPYTAGLPTTSQQWGDCLQKALSFTNYDTEAVNLVDGTQSMHERYQLRIHCEVALILYIVQRQKDHGKDIYVGCSKLSCMACYSFFQGMRETTGINFVTRGCHQKWYFPWGFPQQQSHRLRVAVYIAAATALASDIHARGLAFLRTNSDSSAISVDSTAVSEKAEEISAQRGTEKVKALRRAGY